MNYEKEFLSRGYPALTRSGELPDPATATRFWLVLPQGSPPRSIQLTHVFRVSQDFLCDAIEPPE